MTSYRIATLVTAGLIALWAGREAHGGEPPGRIGFRNYGTDAGLENHDISCVVQDREGFVWACALDAMYRFDGARFERFGLQSGLPSTIVKDMTLDAEGQLLLVTEEGVVRWDGSRFVAVPLDGVPSRALSLRLDPGKRMWVGTEQGLYVEAEPGRFRPAPGWPGGAARVLWMDASGTLQVASEGRVLGLDAQARWWIRDLPGFMRASSSLVRDGLGRLWLGGDGWLAMQPREGAPFEDRSSLIRGMMGAGRRLRVGQRGQLLVPNYRGLLVVEGERAELLRLSLSERAARMRDVLEDQEGTLWVASLGVSRSLGRGLWSVHDVNTGLPSSMVWGLTRGPDGVLWVGTDKGLARGVDGAWKFVPGLEGYSLKAVRVDRQGAVWAAGNPVGLHRYEPWSGRLRTFGEADDFRANYTFDMAWDADGSLWVATSMGLVRGVRTGETWSFSTVLSSTRQPAFWGVERDGAGRVWTTGDGLHVREGGVFRRLGTAEGLRDDRLRFLLVRRDGRVCVTYSEPLGLSCFGYRDGRLVDGFHLDRGTGLHSGVVYQLGEDAAGRLWVGTGAGTHVVAEAGVIEHFGASGGAPGDDFSSNSFLADADGTVWMGTSNGLGRFEGARYTGPATPPRVVLLDTTLGTRTSARPPVEGLEAAHDEATLEVRFADLGSLDESNMEHEVRLLGQDDGWHTTPGRSVRYTALSPGSYRLEVRARNGRGEWGPVVGLGLVVHPPWWASWWARSLGVLLLGAAVAGVVRWRGSRLQRRNAELERQVAARTAELDQAREKVVQAEKLSAMGQLLARLSHEINNPLTAIHNNLPPVREYFEHLSEVLRCCRELLAAHPEGARELERLWLERELDFVLQDTPDALEAMRNAAERIRSTQADLRAFLRGERPSLEPGDLNAVVNETVELLRRSLPPGARLDVRCGEVPRFLLHKGQLGQVVLNLLRNALDAMGEQGEVRVSTGVRDGMAELVVADEGPGVPAELRARIFEPFFTTKDVGKGSGLGLAICRQLVTENHGGTLELDVSVERGACFRVRLPLVQDAHEAA
ncbi:two-component regulator propeller domain-containing protein [Archangium lipolyticum]|uniref:two-component regulator propeller domain-containing protein n=1 Tax=Archangium lipolyticum TaxID=2970465 RepID=UPI00214A2F17|nr:two-component regulator propeller domain-containing protein [Archangium lipolyticum]